MNEGNFVVLDKLPRWKIFKNGAIYSENKKRFIKHSYDRLGYAVVKSSNGGKPKAHKLHRLLAEAFIPNPENKPWINHLDRNPRNYSLSNLEWCTPSENKLWDYATGTETVKGSNHGMAKITEDHVIKIRHLYKRGWSYKDIGYIFNLTSKAIREIIKVNWRHI